MTEVEIIPGNRLRDNTGDNHGDQHGFLEVGKGALRDFFYRKRDSGQRRVEGGAATGRGPCGEKSFRIDDIGERFAEFLPIQANPRTRFGPSDPRVQSRPRP